MPLSEKNILESGLLDLYAIGSLGEDDRALIEEARDRYTALRHELHRIESALQKYARLHALPVDPAVKTALFEQLDDPANRPVTGGKGKGGGFRWRGGVIILLLAGLAWQWLSYNKSINRLSEGFASSIDSCDNIRTGLEERITRLEQVLSAQSRIIPVVPTDNYPETDLYFHLGEQDSTNFLQIKNLPDLADNESFQLWSLKSDSDPIPLDVFQGSEGILIPVEFVEASNAYAITIEARGGAQQPNLEKLIGVFNI